jgi:hypothetical protein
VAKRKHGGRRAGSGRKPDGDAPATETVRLRLTAADRAQWMRAAKSEGLTLSEFMRAAVELAIARGGTR